MGFRFTLQSLLRLRAGQQRRQEIIAQQKSSVVARLENEMLELRGEVLRLAFLASGQSAAEVQFNLQRQFVIQRRLTEINAQLASAREEQIASHAELRRVWKDHQAVETLRAREQGLYLLNVARREQHEQDDLFLRQRRKR